MKSVHWNAIGFMLILIGLPDTALSEGIEESAHAILKQRCYACHSAKKVESGLRLDVSQLARTGGDSGVVFVPGKPDESPLLDRIASAGDDRMPPKGERLSDVDIATLRDWISLGAKFPAVADPIKNHWAWQTASKPKLPFVRDASWPANEVDYYILNRLESAQFTPSPIADRETLLRRAYLDVIGMPPTAVEWETWIDSTAVDWYPRMIDSLLASPHYGERWGRLWLDQARYADSDGYEKDRPRPTAYLYRDWVISNLNADLPFDVFSQQQIAGDLIPNASPAVVSATGFHRNTLTNNEGGIDREEDRVKQTVDRLNTTFSVWMGLTVQCAQCHSHKYDPLSHREYFQLYAFFNDADESNVPLEATVQQKLAYENALQAHRQSNDSTTLELTEARQDVESRLVELENKLQQRFPDGEQLAPTNGMVAYAAFDGKGAGEKDLDAILKVVASKNAKPIKATFHGPGTLTVANGVAVGEATLDTGESDVASGSAVELDGSGQHVELTNGPVFQSEEAFTCSIWVKPTDNLGALVTKINEPQDFRGIDFTNNRGLLEVHLVDKWPENAIKVTPSSARLKNDQWQHVAFSYDGSRKASGVSLYIDGLLVELKVHVDNLTGDFTTDDPWRIGRRKGGTFLKGAVDDLRIYDRPLTAAEVELLAGDQGPLRGALQIARTPDETRTDQDQKTLLDYFTEADDTASALQQKLTNLQQNPPKLERDSAMSMTQRKDPRETFVHLRGEFLNPGEKVSIGTPAFMPGIKARGDRLDRLDLSQWMFTENASLTARVYTNRVWQVYFGQPLVATDADFGTQGAPPTHPDLLDWLAADLVEHNWSVKRFHRILLLSSTYRQASHARPELLEIDPGNSFLARQNRIRVSAENVRDLALVVSGLLDREVNGPSVYPPLPAGVIELAFVDVINRGPWQASTGGARYRRGVYTFFQRTSPYPMFTLFDAPDSNVACTRRETSNTPLQALTLWNDPTFIEVSQKLAREIVTANDELMNRIDAAFLLCFSRLPTQRERDIAIELLEESRKIYELDDKVAREMTAAMGLDGEVTPAEYGAWVALSRALINLDEFITRQ